MQSCEAHAMGLLVQLAEEPPLPRNGQLVFTRCINRACAPMTPHTILSVIINITNYRESLVKGKCFPDPREVSPTVGPVLFT